MIASGRAAVSGDGGLGIRVGARMRGVVGKMTAKSNGEICYHAGASAS